MGKGRLAGDLEAMRKLRRYLYVTLILVSLISLVWWLIHYDQRMESGFPGIGPGMSWQEVYQALGSPITESRCGTWGSDPPPAGCATEYPYLSLSGIRVVWLDADRRVIGKVHFKQP